jgi:hypothetical protein
MGSGYSGTPLVKKLGLKAGMRILVHGSPKPYSQVVPQLPERLQVLTKARLGVDVVHAFFVREADLDQALDKYRKLIYPAGMIWISWPKRSAGVATDITEDKVRSVALRRGLVDVKVCAVDEVWSGLKLVIPLDKR